MKQKTKENTYSCKISSLMNFYRNFEEGMIMQELAHKMHSAYSYTIILIKYLESYNIVKTKRKGRRYIYKGKNFKNLVKFMDTFIK